MNNKNISVGSIGNLLIDILVNVSEDQLARLPVIKGIMQLIDTDVRQKLAEFIENLEPQYRCGGAAANTVSTLAALKTSTALNGKLANDHLGNIFKEQLKNNNVGDFVSQTDDGASGSSTILITPDHERTMNTYLGINRSFSTDDISEEMLKSVDYFYFTGYMWDTDSQKKALRRSIDTVRSAGGKIAFDVADPFAVRRHHKDFISLIKNDIDLLFTNLDEARLLVDRYEAAECAKSLAKICDMVALKQGSRGALACHQGETIEVAADIVAAKDTTGAGDNFAAGFLYGLINNYSLQESTILGCRIAGKTVSIIGAQLPDSILTEIRASLADGSWNYTLR